MKTKSTVNLTMIACAVLLSSLVGCKTEEGSATRDRQSKALRDPFAYGPDDELMNAKARDDVDPTDITGGDFRTLNKKALKRDLESVFGP